MSESEGHHTLDVLKRKSQVRLRQFGHVQRTDSEHISVRGLEEDQKEDQRKTKEKISGCSERGHEVSLSERSVCIGLGQMDADDLLWRPLKATAERKKKKLPHRSTVDIMEATRRLKKEKMRVTEQENERE